MASHKVGGEVDAFCTRCKMDLAHIILAMVGTRIARVRCNTCGGDHAYRHAAGAVKPTLSAGSRVAKPRAPKASAEAKQVISFDELLAAKNTATAVDYNIKTTFAVEQVVRHPTFGLGIVQAVRGDKVDVMFRAENRTLVHGRGGAPAARPAYQPPPERRKGPADKPQASADDAADDTADDTADAPDATPEG